nr:hypothetical protein BaRGS_033891 [Batillaria attramentaria]
MYAVLCLSDSLAIINYIVIAGHQWAALAAAFLVRLLTSAPFGVIYIVAFRGCTTGWSHLLWFDSPHDFVNYVKTVGYVALGTDLLPLLLLLIVNGLLLRFLWSQVHRPPVL